MNLSASVKTLHNGGAIHLADIPLLNVDDLCETILEATDHGWRVASYFGVPEGDEVTLYAVLGYREEGIIALLRSRVRESFPSLATLAPQLQLFEREIWEQCGITPEGHPWLKPLRFLPHPRTGKRPLPGAMEQYRVEGNEIHEVAVGPVHAGIIEPGHFRFQCHGEEIFYLELSLGYQHRGIEAGVVGGPHPATLSRMETVAGDSTVGHTQAHCMIMESLAGRRVPERGEALRGIALELERLANHTGDLGAIAGDVGYLPTASFCGRIRGDFLNMTALLCGSRFGRGLLCPGGTNFDPGERQQGDLLLRVASVRKELTDAVNLLWSTPSVMARLEKCGAVSLGDAHELGLVGPVLRGCGGGGDVRQEHPFGIYRKKKIPVATAIGGDVHARAMVRWLEIEYSLNFIRELLEQLPGGATRSHPHAVSPLAPETLAVAFTEGWRGRICHVALTDLQGRFRKYKITDPSFFNWSGLARALRNQQISDFPLCNKSFNLSYCGFDL